MTKVIKLIGSPNRVMIRREVKPAGVLLPEGFIDKSNYRARIVLCGRCPNYPELSVGATVLCQFGGAQPVQHYGETLYIIPVMDILAVTDVEGIDPVWTLPSTG